ncbi:hypothetical protein [Corynebacterium matruchotii]|uniref:hypothetical protein n=1 Tax=Corynebacterium matruchotii TaxID=43768 RepID=UPI003C717D4A
MFKSRSKSQDSSNAVVVTDYVHSDPEVLMRESGLVAKWLVTGLDKAAKLQHKTIVKYVDRLKEKNPQATPAEIQAKLDKHFLLTITGTGAGAGVTAAIPAVGFVTGAAAVGVESLAFLDAATSYAVASAYLRGWISATRSVVNRLCCCRWWVQRARRWRPPRWGRIRRLRCSLGLRHRS